MNEKLKTELKEWMESIAIALLAATFIITFFVQAFKIPSGSMIPTFQIGDRIFVDKFLYSARIPFVNIKVPIPNLPMRQPKRGDIIVFVSTEEPQKDLVKRLIAFGGETVEIRDRKIYINGAVVDKPVSIRSVDYINAGDYGAEGKAVKVPEDSYFVLGDNSPNSRDSRYWGFVPKKNLLGRVMFIYWPLHRIRLIK